MYCLVQRISCVTGIRLVSNVALIMSCAVICRGLLGRLFGIRLVWTRVLQDRKRGRRWLLQPTSLDAVGSVTHMSAKSYATSTLPGTSYMALWNSSGEMDSCVLLHVNRRPVAILVIWDACGLISDLAAQVVRVSSNQAWVASGWLRCRCPWKDCECVWKAWGSEDAQISCWK